MIAPVASVLDRAGDSLGDFLPQLAGAFVLLVVGLLVARLVGRLVRRGLVAVGLDEFARRWGITDTLVQARLQPSLAGLVGAAVRITLSVIAAFAALTLLGLELLSQSLNEAVLFLPNLLAALALLLAGVVLSQLWIVARVTPNTRWGLTSGFNLHKLRGPNFREGHRRRSVELPTPAQGARSRRQPAQGSRTHRPGLAPLAGSVLMCLPRTARPTRASRIRARRSASGRAATAA